MGEIIPIVDENDNVIDRVEKDSFDKSTGRIYRTTSLFLFNLDGRILIQKRAETKQTSPGKWDLASVAGHVNFGETYIEAIIRETKEEIGLELSPDDIHYSEKIFTETSKGKRRFTQIFWAVANFSLEDLKIENSEISDVKLIALNELSEMIAEDRDQFAFYNNFNFKKLAQEISRSAR